MGKKCSPPPPPHPLSCPQKYMPFPANSVPLIINNKQDLLQYISCISIASNKYPVLAILHLNNAWLFCIRKIKFSKGDLWRTEELLYKVMHLSVNVNHEGPSHGHTQGILTFDNFFCQSPHPHLHLCIRILSICYPKRWNLFIFKCQNCPGVWTPLS